jgi:hypothetical protein
MADAQNATGNPAAKKSAKTVWIVIGVLAALYALSHSRTDRGDESKADAEYREWVDGTADNTWGGR